MKTKESCWSITQDDEGSYSSRIEDATMKMFTSCPPHNHHQMTSTSSSGTSRLHHAHSPRRKLLSQLALLSLLGSLLFVAPTVLSFQPKNVHAHADAYSNSNSMFGLQQRLRPLLAVQVVQEYNDEKDHEAPQHSPTADNPCPTQSSPFVHDFDTPLRFLEAVSLDNYQNNMNSNYNNNPNRITVVKYYAGYCKICQRAGIHYKKIAMEEAEQQQQQQQQQQQHINDSHHHHQQQQQQQQPIDFYQLDAGRMPGTTLKQLGVTKFPFCQIFVRGDCVASFGLSPQAVHNPQLFGQRVRDTLDMLLQRTATEWEVYRRNFAVPIQDNRSARAAVQESLTATMTESGSTDEHVHANEHVSERTRR